jgi:hypothetical protein
MKISTATYSNPDSDNDMRLDTRAVLENTTDSVVELVKTSIILVNADGVTVAGSHDDEREVFIDPKESAEIDINCPYVKPPGFDGKLDQIKAIVDVQLYRREFHNLGELPVPADHETASFIKKGVDIAGMVQIIGATCTRSAPDDDGDVSVGVNVGVRNVSDTYFERVTAKLSIYDQEGAEVDRQEDYNFLAPHSGRVLEASCWGVKAGRLRNCTAKLVIHVYQPVAYHSDSIILTKEK